MKEQIPSKGKPAGTGSMDHRLRGLDGAESALGITSAWPVALRAAVQMIHDSETPMAVLWGTEHCLLCNDAFVSWVGQADNADPGSPLFEIWPDLHQMAAPMLARLRDGHTVDLRGADILHPWPQTVPLGWQDMSFSPLRNDTGQIDGALVTATLSHKHMRGVRTMCDPGGDLDKAHVSRWKPNGSGLASEGTERNGFEISLRASEDKYQAIFDAIDQGFCIVEVVFDPSGEPVDYRFIETNPKFAEQSGLAHAQGRSVLEMLPSLECWWIATFGNVARTGQSLRFEHEAKPLGRTFDVFAARVGSEGSRLVAILFRDITESQRTDLALRESETRFRTLTEGIPQLVWCGAEDGQWTWGSPQWTSFTGQPEADSHGWGWLDQVHPEDKQKAMMGWGRAQQTGIFEADYRLREGATGRYRWFQARALPLTDGGGKAVAWLGTSTDVQNLREMQERLTSLVAELQHRTRNLMAVISSVTDRTIASSESLEDFRAIIQSRLGSISRAIGLLSRLEGDERVTFDELLRTVFLGHGIDLTHPDRQTSVKGPLGVRLRSSAVQTLALAMHELAVHALHYGALSTPDGHLTVTWEVEEGDDGTRQMVVGWSESDVPAPAGPSTAKSELHRQFGRELIERAMPYQLNARTLYTPTPSGLECRIALPLAVDRTAA